MHNILDKKPELLSEYEEISVEDSNMEYLIGLDYCSYRMPCKTILGDRSYKLTKKRFQSKREMLDVYKEAVELKKNKVGTPANSALRKNSTNGTIFDFEEGEQITSALGLESSVAQLKKAITKAKEQQDLKEED